MIETGLGGLIGREISLVFALCKSGGCDVACVIEMLNTAALEELPSLPVLPLSMIRLPYWTGHVAENIPSQLYRDYVPSVTPQKV